MKDLSTPMVSVIMLTYNQEKTIAKAIESVLSQKTSYSMEILIGDDASSDSTKDIVAKYAEQYDIIKVFSRKENIGVTKNAYELLSAATGKYLASCEGDDYWCDEHKLEKQIKFLEENPDFVGCSHRVAVVNEVGKVYSYKQPNWIKIKSVFLNKDFKGIYLPGQSSSIVRRNIFKTNEINNSIIYSASERIGDRTTVLMTLKYGKYFQMKDIMSCYTISFDSSKKSITMQDAQKRNYLNNEFQYTLNIEKYANDNRIDSINFNHYKHCLFCGAIIAKLLKKNEDKNILNVIWKDANNKAMYILSLPYWIIKKTIWKLKNKTTKYKYEKSIKTYGER